jgi:hypothetical protein
MEPFTEPFMSRDGRFDNLLGGQASFPELLSNLDEWAGDQFSHRVLPRMSKRLLQLSPLLQLRPDLEQGSGTGWIIRDGIEMALPSKLKASSSVFSICKSPRASATWSLISSWSVVAVDSNVLITPHCSSTAEATAERRWGAVAANLARFSHGEPLENVVLPT